MRRAEQKMHVRTGMLVQHMFDEHQGIQEVTSVWWTPTGDVLYLMKNGQEVGPLYANLFRPVPRGRR